MYQKRKIVFEGVTALGHLVIYEGDYLEFENGLKGEAFYSFIYSTECEGNVTFRMSTYNYGHDHENCHASHVNKLKVYLPFLRRKSYQASANGLKKMQVGDRVYFNAEREFGHHTRIPGVLADCGRHTTYEFMFISEVPSAVYFHTASNQFTQPIARYIREVDVTLRGSNKSGFGKFIKRVEQKE